MKFEKYLEEDVMKDHQFEDESIISNLYLSSLPMSIRELDSWKCKIKETDNEDKKRKILKEYNEKLEMQRWLLEGCEKICEIKAISLDKLKEHIDKDKKSCDAYFYNPNLEDKKRNLLIEFKNVNRDKMLEYIKNDGTEGLWSKVADSVALLKDCIEFEGYTPAELISNTHLMIVYGERANTVSTMYMNLGSKKPVPKDKHGRQSRAVNIGKQKHKFYSKKTADEVLNDFTEKVKRKGLSACPKGYFGVPIKEPDEDKSGKENVCWYTFFSKKDFKELVSGVLFFDEWDWGIYEKYFR